MATTIWITGTGTGVGKTLLTALLTIHLRQQGGSILAIKPYASGSMEDAEMLEKANGFALNKREISPIFCPEPLSPLAGLTETAAVNGVQKARETIRKIGEQCEILLIEGIGGVAVPIAPEITIGNLIAETANRIIIVGQNRLGILNEMILANQFLAELCDFPMLNVLMKPRESDFSTQSNMRILKTVLKISILEELPFLGIAASKKALKENEKKVKKVLERISNWIRVSPR